MQDAFSTSDRRRALMRVILVVAVVCALLGIWHAFLGNGEEPRATRSTQSAPPERTEPHREENEDPPPSTGDQEGRPFSVLTGLVVDTAGDPVAGATLYSLPVSAYALTGEELRTHCEETQSDDSGRFSLRGLFEDGHELVCRKGGYVPVVQSAATALRRTPVTITLHSGGRFHGRVTTVSGNPIAGATVRAREASRHLGAAEFCAGDALFYSETRTNESGFYEIRGVRPDRRYIVETYARGYAMSEYRIGSPAAWLKPTAAPVNIEMLELVVAVLGVRADGIDYTRSAATSLLLGRHIFYPEGFKRAYRGIPADRLSAPLVRRLRQLRLAGRVVVMAKRVVSSDAPLKGRVDLSLSDAPPERFEIPFVALGSPGWDQVRWLDFGRRLRIRLGRLKIENDPPIPAESLARDAVFLRIKTWKPGATTPRGG